MEIRKIVQNNHVYEFINNTYETYNAWGHETTLFVDDVQKAHNKIRYYNRTWEVYRYQSCMIGCIRQLLKQKEENYIASYKSKNNIKRLTRQKRDMVLNELLNDAYYKELKDVLEKLRYNIQ